MAATLPNVLVTTDWVAQHATDAGVRVVEVDVDTTAYDQGHVPGRRRLELDDRALRHARPRHRAGQEARRAARQDRHRQQDDDRPLRRQQQLVRRVGVLAAEDLRPRGRAHHGRRPQEVAGRGPRSQHRQAVVPGEDLQGRRADLSLRAFLPEVQQAVAGKKARAGRRAQPGRSSPARFSRRPDCPRPASAAATSPARRASPGERTATTTARSRASTS